MIIQYGHQRQENLLQKLLQLLRESRLPPALKYEKGVGQQMVPEYWSQTIGNKTDGIVMADIRSVFELSDKNIPPPLCLLLILLLGTTFSF